MVFLFIILTTTSYSQKFKVVENSRLAKIAGRLKGEMDKYAITIGKTIFLNCKEEVFFADPGWVRHELTHVKQYKKYGIWHFLQLYIFYSIFHDYHNIPFEKEAIAAQFSEDQVYTGK